MFKWFKNKFGKAVQDEGTERGNSVNVAGRNTTPAPVNDRAQGVQATDQSVSHEADCPGSLRNVEDLPQINKPVTITIDGKLYSSLSAEEVSEILKYVGEQLRAKK